MKLVVDANILVSFFRPNPVQFIITNSGLFELELFAPEHGISELSKNKISLVKYSGKSDSEIDALLNKLERFVTVVPSDEFNSFEKIAKKISPHDKDSPFFALALKLKADIWSNEPRLKRQSSVKVLSTD